MRVLQCLAYLLSNLQRFIYRDRSSFDALGQRFSTNEFHHEELPVARFFQSMYGGDSRMIQRRQHAGFTLESRNTLGIVTECFREEFDGDTAAQLGIGGLIYVAHATRPDVTVDLVMCQFGSDRG